MSIFVATAEDARRNFGTNSFSRWHRSDADPNQANGMLAFQRLRLSLFTPGLESRFKMRRSDKVFAIGSCFARGVENALSGQHIDVLSRSTEFDSFPAVRNELKLGFTNKYNAFSIYNELSWALDPSAQFPRHTLVEVGNGLFYDPHTNPALQLAGWEETLKRRAIMHSVTRLISNCRIVIITLGLAEVWFDAVAQTTINTTPVPEAFQYHPNRYQFRVTTVAENFTALESIHALLMKYGHPDTQVIVTVSPVPLMATFSNQDVVVANTYSKSALRAVAQEWAAAHGNVHYFPSYEIVQNSERAATWLEDLRHVRGEVVRHIMGIFLQHYLE